MTRMVRASLLVLAVACVSGMAADATAAPPVISPGVPASDEVITAVIEVAPFSKVSHDTVFDGTTIRTTVTVTNHAFGCPRYIAHEAAQFGPLPAGTYFYDVYKAGTADDGSELKSPTLDSRQIITVTAAPLMIFTASASSIVAGQSVTLVWNVADVGAVRIVRLDPIFGTAGTFGPVGSVTLEPKTTVHYQLQAIGPKGPIILEVVVTVRPARPRSVRHP